MFTKGADNMNTLTHGSSGYHDGKECSEGRDALININNHLKSSGKIIASESRPSILNQYTMS